LQKQIKWIEDHSYGSSNNAKVEVERLKAELAELLEEEAKADALRSLSLYSCRIITGWKFVLYVQSVMIGSICSCRSLEILSH
jgi:hypothetical protein